MNKTNKNEKEIVRRVPPKLLSIDTPQKSVPIYAVHEKENIIETYPTCYTKQYILSDVNYQTSTFSDQDNILQKYQAFIKSIGMQCECALTIYNRTIEMQKLRDETLYKEVGDHLDSLRREMNEINLGRIAEGKNGLRKDKYITMAYHTENLKKGEASFTRIDRETIQNMEATGCHVEVVKTNERLEILHDIYNMGSEGEFLAKTKIVTEEGSHKEVTSFDFDNMRSMGLTVQDVLCASSFVPHEDYFEIGNTFGRALQITQFPTSMSDEFLADLTNVEFNMLTTINMKPISGAKASDMINKQLSLIRTNIAKEQKAAIKAQYSTDMINPDLLDRENDVKELREEVRVKDEHLYDTNIVICIFANDLEKLKSNTETIMTTVRSASFKAETLNLLQEEGFNAALPLCYNALKPARTLTSETLAGFIPFSVLDLMQKTGIIYSQNAVSKNLIKYDRLTGENFNGFILGTPGCFTGDTRIRLADNTTKSFEEMYNSKNTTYDIISCNPKTGEPKIAKGRHVTLTKKVKDIALVSLSNGTKERCTIDHPWLLRSGEYRKATDLRPGTELMTSMLPLIVTVKSVTIEHYEKEIPVYDMESDSINEKEEYENYLLASGIYVHNSGKSFTCKTEMLNVLLGSNSDVIVIDPESEYGAIAELLKGQVIKIAPGSPTHINPMDINPNYDENNGNPVLAKGDFILRLCETIIKSPFGIDSIQETIIDECVTKLYDKYFQIPDKIRKPEDMPTLAQFQEMLKEHSAPEARDLSKALGLYTTGSLNTFAHHTNVNAKNRFIVYDIKDVGEKMKPMAMLIILDSIWNKICENRQLGKNTWFYVDEIYLLFQNELSAKFLQMLFKRARKYGGVPTGITQNVEDLLESDIARKMLSNCNFVQMLNQGPNDREELQKLLNLSDAQVDFITSAPKGRGLIHTGKETVPFYSSFPKNNSIYKCLTSDMKEIQAYKEEEMRNQRKQKKVEKAAKLA